MILPSASKTGSAVTETQLSPNCSISVSLFADLRVLDTGHFSRGVVIPWISSQQFSLIRSSWDLLNISAILWLHLLIFLFLSIRQTASFIELNVVFHSLAAFIRAFSMARLSSFNLVSSSACSTAVPRKIKPLFII